MTTTDNVAWGNRTHGVEVNIKDPKDHRRSLVDRLRKSKRTDGTIMKCTFDRQNRLY